MPFILFKEYQMLFKVKVGNIEEVYKVRNNAGMCGFCDLHDGKVDVLRTYVGTNTRNCMKLIFKDDSDEVNISLELKKDKHNNFVFYFDESKSEEDKSEIELLQNIYSRLKPCIETTIGIQYHGEGQGLKVSEELTFGSAKARIRCIQSPEGKNVVIVYEVKIIGYGTESLEDSLTLYQNILSGEAYK